MNKRRLSNTFITPILLFWHTHQTAVILTFFLVIAFAIRLWGIGFGLPNLEHPDEDAVLMPAITIIKTGNLEPIRMEYGTLHIYLLTLVSVIVYLYSARNGLYQSPEQLGIFERGSYPAVYAHPEFFLGARLLSMILSTAIVLVVYMLATRLGNKRQGLVAAGITAVLPDLVKHAHFATTDITLTFFSALSLYLLLRAYDNWETDSMWAYAGAAFVSGLTASTKLNGVVLIIPLLLIPILKAKSLDEILSMRVLSGPISMALGFLTGTPYAILNIPKFLYWSGYAFRLYNAPQTELAQPSWQWHLDYHATSPNAIIFFLGLAGFVLSLRLWGKRGLIINSFAVFLWLAIVTQTSRQARMWLPTAPVFVLWATLLLDFGWQQLKDRQLFSKWQFYLMPTLSILLFTFLLYNSVIISNIFYQDDVRTRTQHWIEQNIPSGSKIAVEYFAPNLNTNTWSVTKLFHLYDQEMAWYQEQSFDYLVASEAGNNPTQIPTEEYAKRNELLEQACLIETFEGPFLSAESRMFWVYQVPPCD
ncbi:MAG: glycosyltransferase family 39 protein [Anaerolineales bacterium]|nr:glycosyltransferase family 39 protein [Anaerolineales bacterium]